LGEEKVTLLKKSWIFALPSQQENFGVAVLEAIAAGLPVVITPNVQLANFVTSSNTGTVVPGKPEAIAKAIFNLFEDEGYRRDVFTAGPQAVEAEFSLENVGGQLQKMYKEVAAV